MMFDCLMFLTDSCSTLHLYLNRITKSSSVVELRDSKNLIADCAGMLRLIQCLFYERVVSLHRH
jgi:hypothetical protein